MISFYYDKRVAVFKINKKVLLRERKRHTARRVVSTFSLVLTGYPPILTWPRGGGYPARGNPGRVPPIPSWLWGTLPGYPQQGVPHPNLAWGYPTWVPPAGYPPAGPGRVAPLGVCPMEFWVMLQSIMDMGTPPRCGQTNKVKLFTFPSYYVRGR